MKRNRTKNFFRLVGFLCGILFSWKQLYSQTPDQTNWLNSKAMELEQIVTGIYPEEFRDITSIEIDNPQVDPPVVPTVKIKNAVNISEDSVTLKNNPLKPSGLTGAGEYILLIDGLRPRNNHTDFNKSNNTSRLLIPEQKYLFNYNDSFIILNLNTVNISEQLSCPSIHSTFCAGLMIGKKNSNFSTTNGLAPDANVIFLNWLKATSKIAKYAAAGAKIACIPYSYWAGFHESEYNSYYWSLTSNDTIDYKFGYYSQITKEWDDLANNAPYLLIVKSAGNDKGEAMFTNEDNFIYSWDNNKKSWLITNRRITHLPDGANGNICISDIALAKNVLTVGCLINSKLVHPSSSNGPTNDYRIKPELVAYGSYMHSTFVNGSDSKNIRAGGTSYSAAVVAGGIALLQESIKSNSYYKNKEILLASTIKALLINSADDIDETPGPDKFSGYGMPNFIKANNLITDNVTTKNHIHEFTMHHKDAMYKFKVRKSANEKLKVTICWNDPAPETEYLLTPEMAKNASTKHKSMLINDINLLVTDDNNKHYYPWRISSYSDSTYETIINNNGENNNDNLEQIEIAANTTNKDFYITIYVDSNSKSKFTGNQIVSVIVSGNEEPTFNTTETVSEDLTSSRSLKTTEAVTEVVSAKKINGGAKAIYIAGSSIKLKTGFKVDKNSFFNAYLHYNLFAQYEKDIPFIGFTYSEDSALINEKDMCMAKKSGYETNEATNVDILKKEDKRIIVYPNPCNDYVIIDLIEQSTQPVKIEIYSTYGYLIASYNQTGSSKKTLNIDNWTKGMYRIRVNYGSCIEFYSFVKQ